ncbi:S9 family peptidase [Lysobacter pythonis]|uniref:S9 family peptidase n=1 Tax=Solilutibacter pythonis TaxID=2483112 RepID=A0A3M2HEE6_9GAMM|nr:S9 family peptidase [Lysobacter pythonis]RMH88116.1 S9 family peptidase [Lysobacter pythonis]
MRRLLPFALFALACAAPAHASPPLTLKRIMADPDWIGPGVEDAWWRWDGAAIDFNLKRRGENIRDTYGVPVDGSAAAARLDGPARARLDGATPVYTGDGRRSAFIRHGDVFVRDLRTGALTQLTRGHARESRPQWSHDGALVWRQGNDWYRWDGRLVMQAASPQAIDRPGTAPKPDDLRERQLRLIDTLKAERDRRDAARKQDEAWRAEDPTRAPAPVYLGKEVEIADSALSPDGRWLLVITTGKNADAGQAGKMPKYVTESGYEEFEEVRTRVGRDAPPPQRLWLADMAAGSVRELTFDTLPGIDRDPLAGLRKAAGKEALKGQRPVRIASDDRGSDPAIRWSADSRNVAVLVRAVDNKDRWIATVDLAAGRLQPRHRLTDPAWVGWAFNEFGWMPDHRTLWYLSEESGYSHLYTLDGQTRRQLTQGRWEASAVEVTRDGGAFYFRCNRKWPGDYEVCRVPAGGGDVREVTALDSVENFALSPDGAKLLLRWSSSYTPPQLAVIGSDGAGLRKLTDTRSAEYRAIDFVQPEFVRVPSKHGAGDIWGKFYGPETMRPGKRYPVVMFVHGAGYLQNVEAGYPNYFREQMFHHLLVRQGYIVLDLDYRASAGYGRDWRTAIYRWMGKPELEDYLDGIDWLVANKQGDRDRVGIYGGSYGGFMSFMALFKSPGTFKAGAALRPVADWSQYNHAYTSNILNTPELDPEAYKRSSPIEFADALQDHLLISHGMIDDNVFYKDSVMLAQRLIELGKDKWEVASYPLERHAFKHPASWQDQYRRIFELFERTLKD